MIEGDDGESGPDAMRGRGVVRSGETIGEGEQTYELVVRKTLDLSALPKAKDKGERKRHDGNQGATYLMLSRIQEESG